MWPAWDSSPRDSITSEGSSKKWVHLKCRSRLTTRRWLDWSMSIKWFSLNWFWSTTSLKIISASTYFLSWLSEVNFCYSPPFPVKQFVFNKSSSRFQWPVYLLGCSTSTGGGYNRFNRSSIIKLLDLLGWKQRYSLWTECSTSPSFIFLLWWPNQSQTRSTGSREALKMLPSTDQLMKASSKKLNRSATWA